MVTFGPLKKRKIKKKRRNKHSYFLNLFSRVLNELNKNMTFYKNIMINIILFQKFIDLEKKIALISFNKFKCDYLNFFYTQGTLQNKLKSNENSKMKRKCRRFYSLICYFY